MAGTATLLYYTLYISPQRFQVLYWTAGIHYSLAIISGIFLFALITSQSVRATRSKLIDYIIIPAAILAGGFSETWEYLFAQLHDFVFGSAFGCK
ncbi:MAG: hypothetical protein IPP55_16505 [Anaerolineales bacterium]|nr:hypothetical protein [Anaerolineales bacterium]